MSTINADLAIELLIKKYLGAVNTSPNTVYSSDNSIFARPNIVPSLQILNQAIPTVAPGSGYPGMDAEDSLVTDTDWNTTGYGATLGYGGTRQTSTKFPWIAKYTGLLLTQILSITNKGTSYWLGPSSGVVSVKEDNILANQVPYNYDPQISYYFTVYVNGIPVGSGGGGTTPPFLMDQDAGILVFLAPKTSSIYVPAGPVTCDFWRYEGTFGFLLGGGSG